MVLLHGRVLNIWNGYFAPSEEYSKVWPARDPPLRTWFEPGIYRHDVVELMHVTEHVSGWRSYQLASKALEMYMSDHNRKFKAIARPLQLFDLEVLYGLIPWPVGCLDGWAVGCLDGWAVGCLDGWGNMFGVVVFFCSCH